MPHPAWMRSYEEDSCELDRLTSLCTLVTLISQRHEPRKHVTWAPVKSQLRGTCPLGALR